MRPMTPTTCRRKPHEDELPVHAKYTRPPVHTDDPISASETLFFLVLFCFQGLCWFAIGILLGWIQWGAGA